MRAKNLRDLLKKEDRIAVSNITGREASKVTLISQVYCPNVVGGWALGKGGQKIFAPDGTDIPVFATFEEFIKKLAKNKRPNKIIVYSPPEAVYGEIKEIVSYGEKFVETIFIITEHVSIEVTAKIHLLCSGANIDVIGCNTLGIINTYDHVRVGAVGGDEPEETFKPGSATIISNSGNMVNTMASYLFTAGVGTSFGISTGKDVFILSSLKELLLLAEKDEKTKIIVLYIEPGGIYEKEAIEMMQKKGFSKPIIAYITGKIAEGQNLSLGHAGAVVEGRGTSATDKMAMFDEYFNKDPKKGIRIDAIHHLPKAASSIFAAFGWERDFSSKKRLRLNPWFLNLAELGKKIPSELVLTPGTIIEPYRTQFKNLARRTLGKITTRQNMRNASRASANDGRDVWIYGYPLAEIMKEHSFSKTLILQWLGEPPRYEFEPKLVEMCLIAALTNGPGTISAQGAKLSASAGNSPNTAMIATLASIGSVHGGNGQKAVQYLLDIFGQTELTDPYDPHHGLEPEKIALTAAEKFKRIKDAAKEASEEYERIPCLGHPVFRNEPVNYDPREQIIYQYLKENKHYNIFLEFYHQVTHNLQKIGCTSKVLAVNIDAAIACIWLGICWKPLKEKKITVKRVIDIPFLAFALGRAAGGAGEFLDHQDYGTEMDMRIPVSECRSLSRNLPKKKS